MIYSTEFATRVNNRIVIVSILYENYQHKYTNCELLIRKPWNGEIVNKLIDTNLFCLPSNLFTTLIGKHITGYMAKDKQFYLNLDRDFYVPGENRVYDFIGQVLAEA